MYEIIKQTIDDFANEGIVFSNEAQFQFNLAIKLNENDIIKNKYEVVLEYLYKDKEDKKEYIDIVLFGKKTNDCIPIELKYKTTSQEETYIVGKKGKEKEYITYNQGAYDLGSYDFFKDINRIESLVCYDALLSYKGKSYEATKGYSIIITNEKHYYAPFKDINQNEEGLYFHKNKGTNVIYYWQDYSLAHNRQIDSKEYKWINANEKTIGKEKIISILMAHILLTGSPMK